MPDPDTNRLPDCDKVIQIEHEDGTIWGVPATVVAYYRAEYLARQDTESTGGEAYDTTIEEEMEVALTCPEILRRWATERMCWDDDLEPHATKVDEVPDPVRHMSTASVEVVGD